MICIVEAMIVIYLRSLSFSSSKNHIILTPLSARAQIVRIVLIFDFCYTRGSLRAALPSAGVGRKRSNDGFFCSFSPA